MVIQTKPLILVAAAEKSALNQSELRLLKAQSDFDSNVQRIRDHIHKEIIKKVLDPKILNLLKCEGQNKKSILAELVNNLVDEKGKIGDQASFCCSSLCLHDNLEIINKIQSSKGDIFEGLAILKIAKNGNGFCFNLKIHQIN
ncbi:MAG: hypothetical protein KBC11_01415 [Candidatus Pacebacteria bacterium]|nr:hypothetical protein [Candidatus Paceibacterota bacterium]